MSLRNLNFILGDFFVDKQFSLVVSPASVLLASWRSVPITSPTGWISAVILMTSLLFTTINTYSTTSGKARGMLTPVLDIGVARFVFVQKNRSRDQKEFSNRSVVGGCRSIGVVMYLWSSVRIVVLGQPRFLGTQCIPKYVGSKVKLNSKILTGSGRE